ncbi:MAG: alcohol dehydrogenase catalytic domain-containing protein [Firmicutes bacterium]|nr:alcohol dehydrogenase catalytic domain-containing protein [Bacillota bacterium]
MKALFKLSLAPGNMELRECDIPEPGPDEVRIKVKAVGICGSDIHIYHSDIGLPLRPPVITGHEFSGVIDKVGTNVKDWPIGERVTSETAYSRCEECMFCKTGFYNLCPERKTLGYWYNGAFANYTVVPAQNVHRLPENLSFEEGAATEPTACCVHAVNELTNIRGGDLVAVIGPGPIGLVTAQLAMVEGADVVVLGTSKDAHRLETAKELGALGTVDVFKENAVEVVNELTEGRGADVVFECSGSTSGIDMGLSMVRRMGQFTQIGLPGAPVDVDFEQIAYKELKVTGSLGSIWTSWDKALRFLASGRIRVDNLITDILPLDDWKTGFRKFEAKEGLKIMFRPE